MSSALDRLRGSSPHTRGARLDSESCGGAQGIIPAYAGSTRRLPPIPKACSDHPRIRGEHELYPHEGRRVEGSSPHTRGAREDQPDLFQVYRIIPAYAGST